MKHAYPDTLLLLFAREPVPGKVKTRLQPALGEQGTLQLHEDLIRHTARMVAGSGLCPWRFCVAGDPSHSLFLGLGNGNRTPVVQRGEGLGERMRNAARGALSVYRHVVLLGADCASVDAGYLEEALLRLQAGEDIVIGPADDGGYVLMGLNSVQWPLFSRMAWGTDQVLEETCSRLAATQARWSLLEPRWDVDRPEDLLRLSRLSVWHGDLPVKSMLRAATGSPPDSTQCGENA